MKWYIYIHMHTWNLFVLYFGPWTFPKEGQTSNQDKGHLGSGYIHHAFCPCFFRGFEPRFFLNRRFTRSYRLRIMAAPTTFQWGSSSHRSELLICRVFFRHDVETFGWWFKKNVQPYFGKISNLTNIFQRGWNHQPETFGWSIFFALEKLYRSGLWWDSNFTLDLEGLGMYIYI